MRIIISDTSCMIDLHKAALIEELLALPYQFAMPDTLFNDEWLSIRTTEKNRLRKLGLEVRSLDGTQVRTAQAYFNQHRGLKLNDCFALTLAESTKDSILLTGDRLLKRVADKNHVDARGVLWSTDQMERHGVASVQQLHDALVLFREDDLVFLPEREVLKRIRRLAKLLHDGG